MGAGVSEENDGAEARAQASGAPDTAGLAIDLAMQEARSDPFLRGHVAAFLDDQRALIADQRKLVQLQANELSHELGLRHWSLWVRHASGLLKLALELFAGLLLLALVAGISLMVWNAAHSEGLIIESFSVPPDMAAKGITGQIVASQVLDQVTAIQNVTNVARPAKSYANNWGDDLKVEIPDTGMSVGEAYRFLRGWLGHETHISGEVYRTPTGIAITARSGGDAGKTFTGPEDKFDTLVQQIGEHVYSVTQPYRYAQYLIRYASGLGRPLRPAEGWLIERRLTESADPVERSYAWNVLAAGYKQEFADLKAARKAGQNARADNPNNITVRNVLGDTELYLGHVEAALPLMQWVEKQFTGHSVSDLTPEAAPRIRLRSSQGVAMLLGDYARAVSLGYEGLNVLDNYVRNRQTVLNGIAVAMARQHDSAARAAFQQLPPPPSSPDKGPRASAQLLMEAGLENWHAVIALQPSVEQAWVHFNQGWDIKTIFATQIRPAVALAEARTGDIVGAEALIATTPADCYDCVRIRGLIASEAKQYGRADYWFAKTIHDAPSIPFAYADWGQSLLARGKPDDAIDKFKASNQKGPHFGDPLEMWGEALMAKNQSHLAVVKFAEADKYAPNWGRLHLKWGEALGYVGRKEEARAQYQKASTLDLTAPDKAELARVSHG